MDWEQYQELVAALTGAMAAFFNRPTDVFQEAVLQRARGILTSDQWVRSGMAANSPLLQFEEDALWSGYSRLRDVLLAS